MKSSRWILAVVIGGCLCAGPAFAQDQGNGHGKGHEKQEAKWDDGGEYHYSHYEGEIHDWYRVNESHLPPGLAKKDHLPPGLEKQLVVRGTLPPGLQKRIYPCPQGLERRLPPPPPDCSHVVIGGHIVLLNHRTNVVVDVFHFDVF